MIVAALIGIVFVTVGTSRTPPSAFTVDRLTTFVEADPPTTTSLAITNTIAPGAPPSPPHPAPARPAPPPPPRRHDDDCEFGSRRTATNRRTPARVGTDLHRGR